MKQEHLPCHECGYLVHRSEVWFPILTRGRGVNVMCGPCWESRDRFWSRFRRLLWEKDWEKNLKAEELQHAS